MEAESYKRCEPSFEAYECTDLEVAPSTNKKKTKTKKPVKSPVSKKDQEERTIFVGNVDIAWGKRKLISIFSKYGKIETVRFRSAAPPEPEVSKKEAIIKRNVHSSHTTLNAYIRFETKDMMEAALELNGKEFDNHHLRVDRAVREIGPDKRSAVFVGNLPFECEEENLFKHFKDCGDIVSVRIIREKKFCSGKGFGYVNFKSPDAVEVALQLNGKLFSKRNLRVQRCVKKVKKSSERKDNKDAVTPREGQSLGFMKIKGGSRMVLKFMKQGKNGKGNLPSKQKKNRLDDSTAPGSYTGKKMVKNSQFKKIQKNKKKPTKTEKRKAFVSRYLTGSKCVKTKN